MVLMDTGSSRLCTGWKRIRVPRMQSVGVTVVQVMELLCRLTSTISGISGLGVSVAAVTTASPSLPALVQADTLKL